MAGLVRSAIAIGVLLMPACALKLSDKNEPIENGGITGPGADCSTLQIVPGGVPPNTGPTDPKLVGRFDLTDPKNPVFDWPGSYILARFQGTQVTVVLETLSGGLQAGTTTNPGAAGQPFDRKPVVFAAVIDNGDPVFFTVEPPRDGQPNTDWVVAHDLDPSVPHEIHVHRESEAVQGPVRFGGIKIGGGQLLPPVDRARRIEIIGDSITCGYGDRGGNATCPFDIPDPAAGGQRVPVSESNYLAYGSIAARKLDADVVTLCFSGKGVYLNYTEASATESPVKGTELDPKDPIHLDSRTTITGASPDDPNDPNFQVPDADHPAPRKGYYFRTLASGKQDDQHNPIVVEWDFKDPEPQVVVINIGTNDFARDNNQDSVPDGTINHGTFQTDYTNFVNEVRKRRPNAHIILALPPMVTDKFPLDNTRSDFRSILQSIAAYLNGLGDPKVYFMELVEMGTRYGLGCDYHPNLEVHRIMSDQLAGAIRTKTCWPINP
jgi:lysophospholipase L1-like esterase